MNKLVDGKLVPLTEEEVAEFSARQVEEEANADARAEELVRIKRNSLLSSTDWWVLPDRTPTKEQLNYRQALRDIPQQPSFPHDVTWPTKPE